jgi:hypothetical protein
MRGGGAWRRGNAAAAGGREGGGGGGGRGWYFKIWGWLGNSKLGIGHRGLPGRRGGEVKPKAGIKHAAKGRLKAELETGF